MNIMNLAEIMDKSILLMKRHLKNIVLFTLCYGVISSIGIFFLIMLGGIFAVITIKSFTNYLIIGVVVFLLVVLIITVTLTYKVGLIKISCQDFLYQRVYIEDGIKVSFMSIPRVFLIVLISALVFLPIAFVFGVIFYFIFEAYDLSLIPFGDFGGKEIIMAIITLIAIVGGFVVYFAYNTLLTFSLHALVIEKKGAIASLRRSLQLVKNNFWRIFGSLLLFSITALALRFSIESFFSVAINILYVFLKFINIKPNYLLLMNLLLSLIRWPLNIFFWLIISPIESIMISLLYFNQRFKKEGYDLVLRLREIKYRERMPLSEAYRWNNYNQNRI